MATIVYDRAFHIKEGALKSSPNNKLMHNSARIIHPSAPHQSSFPVLSHLETAPHIRSVAYTNKNFVNINISLILLFRQQVVHEGASEILYVAACPRFCSSYLNMLQMATLTAVWSIYFGTTRNTSQVTFQCANCPRQRHAAQANVWIIQ